MDVREFEPEDAEKLSQLIVRNLRQVLIEDYSAKAIEALAPFFTPEKLIKSSKQQFALVGVLGNDLVGTAALDGDRVRTVFVEATRHRSGIGSQLMAALEAYARQHRVRRLYLMSGISACGFYEKLGYKIVKRFERDLNGVPIPVIQMEKVLVRD